MAAGESIRVDSPIGRARLDRSGSTVAVVRLEPTQAYVGIPDLLKSFIDESNTAAWHEIRKRIDYIYNCLALALSLLDEETRFSKKVKAEVKAGKKLLFKPNLVAPTGLDPITHGEGPGDSACTNWTFIAALMRWFHDVLEIEYHKMMLGEAASTAPMNAGSYTLALNGGKTITTEAVMEGRSGDFYGGWGFYFVRKYLAETHPSSHSDDPMSGYEESITGKYLPPGKAGNRLMVYDLNRTHDIEGKARTVPVPNGANFKHVTLHKVIVGGDPSDPTDLKNYPGCVLINVPRLKIHAIDLITNAIKNLGIGLYPMEATEDGLGSTKWQYAFPHRPGPGMKTELPHQIWVPKLDGNTGLPLKDKNGNYIVTKTQGISGTQADVITAVMNQGIFMLHVVDAIQMVNIDHQGIGLGVKVNEGLALASLDPVALDLCCARYMFKTIPMAEARRLADQHSLSTDFLQQVPVARVDGQNIIAEQGFDSPLLRYKLYEYAETKGLGSQKYHVIGWDTTAQTPIASLKGHLGRVQDGKFQELMTTEFYYGPGKMLWDCQRTVLSYLEANDRLTGSTYYKEVMSEFDEDGDGIIGYDEKGRNGLWQTILRLASYGMHITGTEKYGFLHGSFIMTARRLKYLNAEWNSEGFDLGKAYPVLQAVATGLTMSRAAVESKDPFFPSITWGKGKLPSLQFASYMSLATAIYGRGFPTKVSLPSLYGLALQYADKTLNGGKYTGSSGPVSDRRAVDRYIEAISQGASPLDFVLYVPPGFGNLAGKPVPNVVETTDPDKILTATFDNGNERW
jgi:hypothetical protein